MYLLQKLPLYISRSSSPNEFSRNMHKPPHNPHTLTSNMDRADDINFYCGNFPAAYQRQKVTGANDDTGKSVIMISFGTLQPVRGWVQL